MAEVRHVARGSGEMPDHNFARIEHMPDGTCRVVGAVGLDGHVRSFVSPILDHSKTAVAYAEAWADQAGVPVIYVEGYE